MPYPTVEAEVTFLSTEDGGRNCMPVWLGYKPHLVVQSPDVRVAMYVKGVSAEDYLGVIFLAGPEPFVAGQTFSVKLGLGYHPEVNYIALQEGATFTIREGGRIVGYGKVLQGISIPVNCG